MLYLLQLFVASDLFIICLPYILQSPPMVPRPCDAHNPSEPSYFQLRNLGLSQRRGPECRHNYHHLIAKAIHKEEAANSLRCFWARKVSGRERVDDGREGDEHFVVSFVIVVIVKVDSLWKHRHTWKNVIHSKLEPNDAVLKLNYTTEALQRKQASSNDFYLQAILRCCVTQTWILFWKFFSSCQRVHTEIREHIAKVKSQGTRAVRRSFRPDLWCQESNEITDE